MKKMGKLTTIAIASIMTVSTASMFACSKNGNETATLNVYNCYDYIEKDLLDEFKTYYEQKAGVNLNLIYSEFDTPEDCYNDVKINPGAYDVICPSDYMIEKMAREGLLEEISMPTDGNYNKYVSPFIKQTFESLSWGGKSLANYAVGYMWGTLGLVYNPETVTESDMATWTSLWNDKYNNKFTIKDSVRDTYFVGLAKHNYSKLIDEKQKYENGGSLSDYQSALKLLFNDTQADTIKAVEPELLALKSKSKGMEVDSGKDDIIRGSIDIYFAWSGDAVYAMDEADESEKELYYSIPEEGSNVWFDGWCVPKGAKNKAVALEFIDFMCKPQNVIKNMDTIGYVSCMAGQEIFEWITETYGSEDGNNTVDLSYFFGAGDYTVKFDTFGRQFSAQYPDKKVIDRCVVMSYFPDADNERITNMWAKVKVG